MAKYLGAKPEESNEGRQIVMYGPPFSGKTTTLADPGVKVLLCDMDHNTSPLENADNVTIYPVDSFEHYLHFKESVRQGYFQIGKDKIPCNDFDIICFDSFTRYEELIKQYVITEFAPTRKRELKDKFGAQSDWQDLQDIEVREVREWQAMTRTHGFCVVWMGHDMATYDTITEQVNSIQLALQGKYASSRIMGAVDAVMYMQKFEKDGKVIRGVYTQQHGAIRADARLPVEKREKLPVFVPDMKWSKILPYLGYKKATKITS